MVGSSHVVSRKVTKAKLEINKDLSILKRPYCICHHVTTNMNELVTANGDLHLLYNAQLYL